MDGVAAGRRPWWLHTKAGSVTRLAERLERLAFDRRLDLAAAVFLMVVLVYFLLELAFGLNTSTPAPVSAPVVMQQATATTVTPVTAPPATTVVDRPSFPISSTMYCEGTVMANGRRVHDGAVSSHVLPRNSRWRVLSGPYAGRVFVVEDTGPLANFDMYTASCPEAIRYGLRSIRIEAA